MEWRRFRETIGRISQRLTKLQTPTSKFPKSRRPFKYESRSNGALFLNEAAPDDGAPEHPVDLEERTAQFGEAIVQFCKKIPRDPTSDRLIGQLTGCGTSVGANYCEANERVSKKDFRNIIGRCVKEAKETKYFLRLIAAAEPRLAEAARTLYREAKELHMIFASMYRQ